jgi:uncharacterized protein (DUF433 family)
MAPTIDLSTGPRPVASATRLASRSRSYRLDRASKAAVPPVDSVELADLARSVREELTPSGPIEVALVDRIVAAMWRLQSCSDGSPEHDPRDADRAERSLRGGLRALFHVRALRVSPPTSTETAALFDVGLAGDGEAWRKRLTWDGAVSQDSPVVRGTWITAGQVVSRIIDGWSWADVLRAHPELCDDDIRACLSFTVEDEESR